MKEVLKKSADTITQKPITVEVDIQPKNKIHAFFQRKGWAANKCSFEIRPLTLAQLQKISAYLLDIEFTNITPDQILKLALNHSETAARIVAVAVTDSRKEAKEETITFLMQHLQMKEMESLLGIVLGQLNILDFTKSILSLRSLSLMDERSPQEEAEIIAAPAPGVLSAVS